MCRNLELCQDLLLQRIFSLDMKTSSYISELKNTNAMNKKATELLKKYGFDRIKAADMIDNYNFEDRKLVEIVKATYF